jgi:hypothetical protein
LEQKTYTPTQVIREITNLDKTNAYGMQSGLAKRLDIPTQRVNTMVKPGPKSVLAKTLLRLLLAAHQEGILQQLFERMRSIKIEPEQKNENVCL